MTTDEINERDRNAWIAMSRQRHLAVLIDIERWEPAPCPENWEAGQW